MVRDISAVVWKELQELWFASRNKGSAIRILLWVGIFGVLLPLQHGADWLSSALTLYFWVWFPMLFVSAAVTGAFAREREYHTLETLLATRLSDTAILVGKMLASMLYGWGLNVVCILVAWGVINGRVDGLVFYEPALFFGGLLVSLLGAWLVSGVGVLISMDAPTFQSAARGITIAVLVLFLPVAALDYLPDSVVEPVFAWLDTVDIANLVGLCIGILLPTDLVLLGVARGRFRRTTLLLQ